MKRYLLLFALLSGQCFAQVPVTPIVQPRVTFVDGDGAPCAGCTLATYAAGTTTPLATYTDATGTSQNTNPIILDAAGGANIWLGANSYKLILKDASGATIWSVDQIRSGSLLPCSSANAIQAANSAVNGLNCDPAITINTVTHTINIGTLPTNHVTIGALGAITAPWTLDVTSPATALASLGGGVVSPASSGQIAIYEETGGNTVIGSFVIPDDITALTRFPDDASTHLATTAYVNTPGGISPTAVKIASGTPLNDNQGNGAKVQHSTGTTTPNDLAKFDASGNVVDSGAPAAALFATSVSRTGSRFLATPYQNTGTTPMYVSGYATISGGSGDSMITFLVGPSSPTITCDSDTTAATISGEHVGFRCIVPPGSFYEVTGTNLITAIGQWTETQ